ncbi:hypothetical protein Celal_3295 [Cellulophaga algicola DSM 14237]|uniref:Lipoprotein n=1 Tax=Cellulophaga algicola (strain DSM 14237 / IC166 / ACAM 630) TaxID=688270 RepID=E6X602_CELAD|nr:hypothetical protein [Cellulophaga algicola]ADV50561.1 hypothetical protein Celal_3295 [Cellulophaga algicola DSM 14237]
MRLFILIILLTMSSCKKDFILRANLEGKVFNHSTKKPINNAKVLFIDCLNSDCNGEIPTFTNEQGDFYIKKEIKKYFLIKPNKYSRPYYSYTLVISKKGYISDTIDIRNYNIKSNTIILDVIELKK